MPLPHALCFLQGRIAMPVSEATYELVALEDPDAVAAAIRHAIADDALVDRAAEMNERVVRERLSLPVVRSAMLRMVEHVIGAGAVAGHRGRRH